ncbi:MAG: mobilization protein [Flavisolibacter sp.]|nr:mobilization protein [Flavisolibacter sp.]
METMNHKNKGGRPKKAVKRNYRLRVACNLIELKTIQLKAEKAKLTVSEFLREAACNSHIDIREKTLPREVLDFTGKLSHLAANINSLAYKNNAAQTFNAFERAELRLLATAVKQMVQDIKYFLQ